MWVVAVGDMNCQLEVACCGYHLRGNLMVKIDCQGDLLSVCGIYVVTVQKYGDLLIGVVGDVEADDHYYAHWWRCYYLHG